MGKGRTKRVRRDSGSSIDSTSIDTLSRPGTADPQGEEMMRHHITALYLLSKKGKNTVVKVLIERLVSLFNLQEKKADEKEEDLATQLSVMKSRAEEVEANLQGQILEMRKMMEEIKNKTAELDKKPSPAGMCFEEGYRLRSLVFSGLQLPTNQHIPNSQKRVQSIKCQVEDVIAFLGIAYPVCDVFQMGRHLVKVRFGCRDAVKEVLSRAPKLRYSPFEKVHIRPSLTAEERVERANNLRNAQHERKERESRGEHVFLRSLPNFLEFSVERRRGPYGRTNPNSSRPNQTRV